MRSHLKGQNIGSIRARPFKTGGYRYQAEIRLKGHPVLTATFDRKNDAKAWVQKVEADIRCGRMIDKKWAIIRKVEPKDDCIYTKPKWMHWRTFYRLKDQAEELDRAIIRGGYVKFSVLPGFASSPLSDYFDLSAP